MKCISFFLFAFLVAVFLNAMDPAPVVRAEREFSRAAGERGLRAAFLEYLADNSIVFQKTAVSGKKVYEARPDTPGILYWQPSLAELSAAGDLAYSTGPWQWQNKQEEAPVAFGQFASIWRKQQDGGWKVEVDLGCTHDEPSRPVSSYADMVIPERAPGKSKPGADQESLMQADREFASAAGSDTGAAYRTWLVEGARVLRNGMEPVETSEKIAALLEKEPGAHTWEPAAAGIASSGDLGYTYGTSDSGGTKGNYMRVWKRQGDDRWKVVLEVISSITQ